MAAVRFSGSWTSRRRTERCSGLEPTVCLAFTSLMKRADQLGTCYDPTRQGDNQGQLGAEWLLFCPRMFIRLIGGSINAIRTPLHAGHVLSGDFW
jgi:hypothetical protein